MHDEPLWRPELVGNYCAVAGSVRCHGEEFSPIQRRDVWSFTLCYCYYSSLEAVCGKKSTVLGKTNVALFGGWQRYAERQTDVVISCQKSSHDLRLLPIQLPLRSAPSLAQALLISHFSASEVAI